MKINLTTNFKPSFGKVIPVKKIVLKGDTSEVKYYQQTLDGFETEEKDEIDTSCNQNLADKTILALNKILLKNDKAEKNTYENALNNMIRRSFANADNDYKIPLTPIKPEDNNIIAKCSNYNKNYIFTGREARELIAQNKRLGGVQNLVNEFNNSPYKIEQQNKNYSSFMTSTFANSNLKLKNEYGGRLGLVIYADTENVPLKGDKGFRTEINIKGIDFEPVQVV